MARIKGLEYDNGETQTSGEMLTRGCLVNRWRSETLSIRGDANRSGMVGRLRRLKQNTNEEEICGTGAQSQLPSCASNSSARVASLFPQCIIDGRSLLRPLAPALRVIHKPLQISQHWKLLYHSSSNFSPPSWVAYSAIRLRRPKTLHQP